MKHAVITGANGFLGSHLAHRLVREGVRVTAIDREGCDDRLPQSPLVTFLPCQMKDLDKLSLSREAPDAFYHFAWQGVAPEYREDFGAQYANISYCLDAARLAARIESGRFILPGSTMEYMYTPGAIGANALPTPQNAYGSVKIACRFLCQALCQSLGLPFLYAVITSIYGVGREDNNVLFYIIRSLLHRQRPSLTKMEQRWDFVHISDAIEALYRIGCQGKPGAFYAVGNGENRRLAEYVSIVHGLIDSALPLGIGEVPYKTDKLPHSMIDPAALMEDTGFRPLISFEEGIREVIDHYRQLWNNEGKHE